MFHIAITLAAGILITNLNELATAEKSGVRFAVTGTAISPSRFAPSELFIENDDGAICLFNETQDPFVAVVPGDRVRVHGRTDIASYGLLRHNCKRIERISHDAPPEPHMATLSELSDGTFDNRLVRTEGTLRDVHKDEI